MRKRILSCLIVFSILLVTSCNLINTGAVSTSEESQPTYSSIMQSSFATSDPPQTTAVTSYSIPYDFEFENRSFNFTYEDVYDFCVEKTGTDLDVFAQSDPDNILHRIIQDEYVISYIDRFQTYLNLCALSDSYTGIIYDQPEPYEYHITRRIIINDDIFIDEFTDEHWAEVSYSESLDIAYEHNSFIDENQYPDGYYFAYDESITNCPMFHAYYISGPYIIHYYHYADQIDTTNYILYLELCDRLGLPTSSEMTEEVEQLMTTPNPEPFFVTETGPSYLS